MNDRAVLLQNDKIRRDRSTPISNQDAYIVGIAAGRRQAETDIKQAIKEIYENRALELIELIEEKLAYERNKR